MTLELRFTLCAGALAFGGFLMSPSPADGADIICPADPQHRILGAGNSESDFVGLSANELLIPVALDANLAYLAQQYRQAGIGHARVLLSWEGIQPQQTPGPAAAKFDWGFTDLQVNTIARTGIRTVGIIDKTPDWASFCSGKPYYAACKAANIGNYEDFVYALVQRYGPAGTNQIHDWSIRIENGATAATPHLTKEDYVVELNAAFSVIKANDPSANVWGPEVLFLSDVAQNLRAHDWVTYVVANGNLDIFSIHLYPTLNPPAPIGGTFADFTFNTTQSVCSELSCDDPQGIRLAVSEMAVLSPPQFTGPEQAAHLTDMYACAWAGGAKYAMWFVGTQWRNYVPDIPCDTAFGIFRYVNVVNPLPPYSWTCQPATPTPPSPNKVVPKYAYGTLQVLGNLVMGTLPQLPNFGILGTSSNPCQPNGAGSCSSTLYWYSATTQPQVLVQGPGITTPCRPSNQKYSAQIFLSAGTSATYSLYAADASCAPVGLPLDQLVVSAAEN
jgi:hypothetical protein